MRCLKRNKQKFYYAQYTGKTPILDEYGNATLESRIQYSSPILMEANISSTTKGSDSNIELFGTAIQYDKVIVTDDMACPINEYSVLCVDVLPSYDSEGNLLYDYIVKRVGKSLNSISYAITKVERSK